MKKKNRFKKFLLILMSIILFIVICWGVFSIVMYNSNFNVRCEDYEPLMLRVDDFEGLKCEEYSFASNKGQMLSGYLYSVGDSQHGVVVMAHGFGGGHNSYMDAANYFATNGYYVFAYDATGSGNSEGEGVGGVPQGVIDLDYAINFIKTIDATKDLSVVLFGHSWGAYSVCSVLNFHPEVKAVVECSGFARSSDMFESGGKSQAGDLIYTMTPFIRMYEGIKYGKYAGNTAMDGFEASDAAVMIAHSADDDVIGIEYGLDKYYEKYKDDSRFTFLRFEDKGHNGILNDPNNTYGDEIDAEYAQFLKTLDYDYKAEENKVRIKKDKEAFINEHLDRAKWSSRLDTEMFAKFVELYDNAIK